MTEKEEVQNRVDNASDDDNEDEKTFNYDDVYPTIIPANHKVDDSKPALEEPKILVRGDNLVQEPTKRRSCPDEDENESSSKKIKKNITFVDTKLDELYDSDWPQRLFFSEENDKLLKKDTSSSKESVETTTTNHQQTEGM